MNDLEYLEREFRRARSANEALLDLVAKRDAEIESLKNRIEISNATHAAHVSALESRLGQSPRHKKGDITAVERRLASHLLYRASDEFSNHGCNDLNLVELGITLNERRALCKAMEEFNNSPEDYDPEDEHNTTTDWFLMTYLAARIAGCA